MSVRFFWGVKPTATVIYADSLLIVNFSMDFLALYITVTLMHMVVRPIRMMLAAMLGAAWALTVTLLEPYTATVFWQIVILAADVACAGIMISAATHERTISLKATLTFIAVNIGLGGIMTALYSFVGRVGNTSLGTLQNGMADSSPGVFIAAALIAGAVSIVYGKFRTRSSSRRHVSITLAAFGRETILTMLSDSGNLLCEPFSGKPVVIISARSMSGVLPRAVLDAAESPERISDLPEELSRKVRLIPASGVMGKGMLLCFIPDRIGVDGSEVDAVAALDIHSGSYDGCDGIIPQILLTV